MKENGGIRKNFHSRVHKLFYRRKIGSSILEAERKKTRKKFGKLDKNKVNGK